MEFQLRAAGFDFWAMVRLRGFGDRWIAVADIAGDSELGLANTPREAVEEALRSLGFNAAGAFLSDPAMTAALVDTRPQHDGQTT